MLHTGGGLRRDAPHIIVNSFIFNEILLGYKNILIMLLVYNNTTNIDSVDLLGWRHYEAESAVQDRSNDKIWCVVRFYKQNINKVKLQ